MSILKPRQGRRSVIAGLTLALGSSLALLPAGAAHAATTPFIVIGTSDVSDSNLVKSVIEPRFEAAYPQYDLQYVPLGTGAALDSARAGNGAAVIVHAAALENQFVAQGYSLEPYGRSVFWGDYVLAGPAGDPAGVLSGASTDVVTALEKVAAAGAAGKANFVARGGKPGTAVQEHALWALTNGVTTCAVGSTNGGGKRPSTTTDPCDNPDTPATYPAWYHTGDSGSQAGNVNIANTCNFPGGNCYVFTDRGTLKYLQSTGGATNLKVLTRNNATTARGGVNALVNVFHAYGVNPAKFANPGSTKTDAGAASLFLDFMTQPATQAAIGSYLAADNDPVFIPAAAPKLTGEVKKKQTVVGKKTKIKGSLTSAIPGYPAVGGAPVNLLEADSASPLAIPRVVASATTDAAGNYKFKAKLAPGKNYRVGVGSITKIQLPALNPQFGDITVGTSSQVGTIGGIRVSQKSLTNGRFVFGGKLKPKAAGKDAKVKVYAAKAGAKLHKIGKLKLKNGDKRFVFKGKLAKGAYRLQFVYSDKTDITPVASEIIRVKVS